MTFEQRETESRAIEKEMERDAAGLHASGRGGAGQQPFAAFMNVISEADSPCCQAI